MWQKHWIIWKHVSLLLETQNYIKHAGTGKTHEKQSILLLLKFKNMYTLITLDMHGH